MAIDKPTSQTTENIKQWASNEDINKSKSDIETSKKIIHVNNILQTLDLPDNQEELFREILRKQDTKSLKELEAKSKNEVLVF